MNPNAGTAQAAARCERMPFYGDIDDYCPPRRSRAARCLAAACAVCLVVFGLVAVF